MSNHLLDFYKEHKISPVHQNLEDFSKHLERRERLYCHLGLAPISFQHKRVLELGPGGGHNALAFFAWGATVDFVEPNPKACEEIPQLLEKQGIEETRFRIFPEEMEQCPLEEKYAIIVAEGFIPGLNNRAPLIKKVMAHLATGSVFVCTCIDDISGLFEMIKRALVHRVCHLRGARSFDEKVAIISQSLKSHQNSLKGFSRPMEDWAADQFLNPAWHQKLFSMEEAIKEFSPHCRPLGASPSLFTHLNWYKDPDYCIEKNCLEQFQEKRHLLLSTQLKDCSTRQASKNAALLELAASFRSKLPDFEMQKHSATAPLIESLENIKANCKDLGPTICAPLEEAIGLLADPHITASKIAQSPRLKTSFGRGQQYLSFIKKDR